MSYRLNTNRAAMHAHDALLQNNEIATQARLPFNFRNKLNAGISQIHLFTAGITIQQKVIQMQAAQFNIRNSRNLLTAAEWQLIKLKEIFTLPGMHIANEQLDADNTTETASGSYKNSSYNLGGFESFIDISLAGINNYKQLLDANDEILTSAISNSTASVSCIFEAGFSG